jgi:type I restriction enzyme S subunit
VIKLGEPCTGGIPTLRSSDARRLFINEIYVKKIAHEIEAGFRRTRLMGSEIVVIVRGTLGGVAVVPNHMAGYNVSREVAVVPIKPYFSANFFSYAIGCEGSQSWLTGVAKCIAYTGINIEDLKLLPLPVPPLAEQQEIVRRVEALFKFADAIEKRTAAAAARAEKLTQAVLARAFRGELVPTEAELARAEGRHYEPASVLLQRIQAGREQPATGRPTAKKRKGSAKNNDANHLFSNPTDAKDGYKTKAGK